jgi:uncharacterized protein YpmS
MKYLMHYQTNVTLYRFFLTNAHLFQAKVKIIQQKAQFRELTIRLYLVNLETSVSERKRRYF